MNNEGLRARARLIVWAREWLRKEVECEGCEVCEGEIIRLADFSQQIREEDCRVMCELCNGPDSLDGAVRDKTGKWVHVLIRGTQICTAVAIRNLAEKEPKSEHA